MEVDDACIPHSQYHGYQWPDTRPTNNISMEFQIQWNFVMLLFITYSTDHNEILHTSRQEHCRDVCKISLGSNEQISNQNTPNFYRIWNTIEIPLVGWAPGDTRRY